WSSDVCSSDLKTYSIPSSARLTRAREFMGLLRHLFGSRLEALAKMVYRCTGAGQKVVMHCFARAKKCITERICIGRTMAFDDDTTQAQQGRAIVTAVVHLVSEPVENRLCHETGRHR